MISSPVRNFLSGTFVNMRVCALRKANRIWTSILSTRQRAIENGSQVRIYNERGSFIAKARVTGKAREGLVVDLSVWWKQFAVDGENANEVTSQRLTDMATHRRFTMCRCR